MRNAIPPIKAFGASWAADNIESPFLYLPCSIAAGTALGTAGLPIVSNITGAPSTFAVVDADSSADNNEGYFTLDHATDVDYIWPGLGYDADTHGLYQLGNLLPAGTVEGIGGKTLLIAFTLYIPTAASAGGGLLSWGNRALSAGWAGWYMGGTPSTGVLNFGVGIDGGNVQGDITAASLTPRDTPIRVACLIDAQNAEILSAIDGQAVAPADKATVIAALNSAPSHTGFMFGGRNGSDGIATRTVLNSYECRMRDLLIMDLTGYASAQADFYELADRLHRAPAYTLPHWMDRF